MTEANLDDLHGIPAATVSAPDAGLPQGDASPDQKPAPTAEKSWFGLRRSIVIPLLGSFVPLLVVFFFNLWSRPHYQFFPLALAGAGLLAWTALPRVPRPLQPGGGLLTAALLTLSWLGLGLAVVLFSPWLTCVAAILCFVGLLWRRGGWSLVRALSPALLIVLTILPPPLNGDQWFVTKLRFLAVISSSRLLDLLGVVHLLSGHIIELPQQKLLVEEACSGINSVLLTSAVCVFYLLWRRRPWWWILVCLPSALAGVVLGNIARITLGAWLKYDSGTDILSGWRHEFVGLTLVVLYLLLIVSLDQFMQFLTAPIVVESETTEDESGQEDAAAPSPAIPILPPDAPPRRLRLSSLNWWLTAGAFASLGLLQLGLICVHLRPLRAAPESHLSPGASFSMPEEIEGWKRLQPEAPIFRRIETWGVSSWVWHYSHTGVVAAVALDYPFRGYHDVTVCYTVAGWRILQWQRIEGGPDGRPPHVEVEMEKGSVSLGALWFSTIDEQGRWMEQPVIARRFLDRWPVTDLRDPTSYRVQLLVTSYQPLSTIERKEVDRLFEAARSHLARQLLDQLRLPAKSAGGAQ